MRALLICSLALLATACGMYQSSWECPPGKGIGCKPVSEVLDMIVEKENGEDVFTYDRQEARRQREQQKKAAQQTVFQENESKLYLLKEHAGDPILVEAP